MVEKRSRRSRTNRDADATQELLLNDDVAEESESVRSSSAAPVASLQSESTVAYTAMLIFATIAMLAAVYFTAKTLAPLLADDSYLAFLK